MIKERLSTVLSHVRGICARVGRDAGSVTVVGVTKYSDAAAVNEAVDAGLLHIAENRVQSAKEKFPMVVGARHAVPLFEKVENCHKVTTHLIGHLQTNKAKDAVELFDFIQSVDSMKLAVEIDKRAGAAGKVQDVLIQLDIAREEQKFGLPEEELDGLLNYLEGCGNIRTRGLMCMAPLTEDKESIRAVFRRLREQFDCIKKEREGSERIKMEHLSMGMSGDYEIAIEEGATMIRIGSAIFK
jgi:pyridoxal phosphate enzyme (YggS family)